MSELGVNRRVSALFKGMSTDFLLREQFVTDPAQVMAEFVEGKSLPDEVAAGANQLLYAMLSNRGLLGWIREYAAETKGAPPSGEEFASELSRALVRDGDEPTMLALIRGASASQDLFAAQSSLLRAFISVLGSGRLPGGAVASGTEFTPGTAGTNVSPGTNITPGGVIAGGGVFSGGDVLSGTGDIGSSRPVLSGGDVQSGTEFTPGTAGTNVSPGTNITPGGVVAGGGVFSGGDVLSGTGDIGSSRPVLSGADALSGTNVSPGTGTNVSPGTGTQISPGGLTQSGLLEAQVTLEAIVQFAQQLRRIGALNVVRFG